MAGTGPVQTKQAGIGTQKPKKEIPEDGFVVANPRDNLWNLAHTYGVNFADIKKWNADLGADFKLTPGVTQVKLRAPSTTEKVLEGAKELVGWNDNDKPKTTARQIMKRVDDKIAQAVELYKNKDVEGAEEALSSARGAAHRVGSGVPNLFKSTEAFNAHVLKQAPELRGLVSGADAKASSVATQKAAVSEAATKLETAQKQFAAAQDKVSSFPDAVDAAQKQANQTKTKIDKAQTRVDTAANAVNQVVSEADKALGQPSMNGGEAYHSSLHMATQLVAHRSFPAAREALDKAWQKASSERADGDGQALFANKKAFTDFVAKAYPALAPIIAGKDGKTPLEKLSNEESAALLELDKAKEAHDKTSETLSDAKDQLSSKQGEWKTVLTAAQNQAKEAKDAYDAELKKLKAHQK